MRARCATFCCNAWDGDASLDHVVVAWSEDAIPDRLAARLPPALAKSSALPADDATRLADVVTQRLSRLQQTLGERLPADSRAVRLIREGGTIPLAGSLAGIRGYLEQLPDSLNEQFGGRDHTLWEAFNALESQFEDVLSAFGGETEQDHLPQQVAARVAEAAATGAVLWVVDNIPETPQPLETWCPAKRHVTLLCTSRRTGLKRIDHIVQVLPLATEASIDPGSRGADQA